RGRRLVHGQRAGRGGQEGPPLPGRPRVPPRDPPTGWPEGRRARSGHAEAQPRGPLPEGRRNPVSAAADAPLLRLTPDGVLRLVARPVPEFSIESVVEDKLVGTTRTVKLKGTSKGMPSGTMCRLVCQVGTVEYDPQPAPITIDGTWQPETPQT